MTENGKPETDGLKIWLIIDTISSVIFMLYYSFVMEELSVGIVQVAPIILVYWLILLFLSTGLLFISWVLKKKGRNTGSLVCSIFPFIISLLCLIFVILLQYY